MRNYISIEPVRTLSAVLALGVAIITLLALQFNWDESLILAINGVWAAIISVVGSIFVRNEVTPTEALVAGD